MLRYLLAAVAVLILLAVALRSRPGNSTAPAIAVRPGVPPVVRIEAGPEGRVITVKHALRGSVTRAAIVYELEGEDHTAAVETDCRRGGAGSVTDDGYATVLELTGPLPEGASRLRLVVESETGTERLPLEP